ncbi:hypothetical protein RND81_14G246400 [Saponaria officinalis]|uniref:Uncharacterized protein n=1 Tax=Saponaria officinalis TaxID=3572 RepID=A0AAW1GUV7_SAPOF
MLEEFKLQACYLLPVKSGEATELQEINLDDEEKSESFVHGEHSENTLEIDRVENTNDEKPASHPNLKILELVGFLGARCDVQLTLAIVDYARSLHTIICDTRGVRHTGTFFYSEAGNEYDVAKSRARKLAKIVAPKVKLVMI